MYENGRFGRHNGRGSTETGEGEDPAGWPEELRRYLLVAVGFVATGLFVGLLDEWRGVSHLAAANAALMIAAVGICGVAIRKARAIGERPLRPPAPTSRDPVTGLPDEQYFWLRLREEYRRARRLGVGVSLTLVDVNNLSAVNDTYGRSSGDAVLKHIAGLVESSKRASDVAARLSDDEIAIILLDCDLEGANAVVRRLEHLINRQPPIVRTNGGSMTLWVGVCTGTVSALEGEASSEELVARARHDLDMAREERDRRRVRWAQA
jgi:diguanylate cyclase (GGDEF)-like protein